MFDALHSLENCRKCFWKFRMDTSTGSGRWCNILESRLVSERITHHMNKTCPPGDSMCLAPSIGQGTPRTCEVNRVTRIQHWADQPGRLMHPPFSRKLNQCSSYGSLFCSGSSPYSCLCDYIYLGCKLLAVHPVINEAGTLVFHVLTIATTSCGYPFNYVIWWPCLIRIPMYMQNSGRDTSFTVNNTSQAFSNLATDQHMTVIMMLWRMMVELLA